MSENKNNEETVQVERGYSFTQLSDSVIDDERVDKNTLLVYMALSRFADRKRICWPSYNTLAKKARVARSTVQAGIAKLVELGYLAKQNRSIPGKRENASNHYTITDIKQAIPPSGKESNNKGEGVPLHGIGVPPSGKEPYTGNKRKEERETNNEEYSGVAIGPEPEVATEADRKQAPSTEPEAKPTNEGKAVSPLSDSVNEILIRETEQKCRNEKAGYYTQEPKMKVYITRFAARYGNDIYREILTEFISEYRHKLHFFTTDFPERLKRYHREREKERENADHGKVNSTMSEDVKYAMDHLEDYSGNDVLAAVMKEAVSNFKKGTVDGYRKGAEKQVPALAVAV